MEEEEGGGCYNSQVYVTRVCTLATSGCVQKMVNSGRGRGEEIFSVLP